MKRKDLLTVVVLLILLCVSVIVLSGCQKNKAVDVPFGSIERQNFKGIEYYDFEEPALFIITSAEEIDVLGNTISQAAQDSLQTVDFKQNFVIAAFIGNKAELFGPRSGIEIHTLQKRNETLTIFAHYYQPGKDVAIREVKVSPYHLIKVDKQNLQGNFKFVLNINDTDTIYVDSTVP